MLPVCNNNGAQGLAANTNFCAIVAPTPQLAQQPPAGQQQSCYMIDLASYYIAASSSGVGTVVTFQELGLDQTWRPLASPVAITLANSTNYNGLLNGPFHGLRINISGLVGSGATYAELKGTIRGGV
jgi:hypothetical protein